MATTKINTPELFDFSATNTALQLPTGTTAQRPTSPSAGEWRFNTTEKYVEYWDGGEWRQIDTDAPPNPDDFPSQNFNVNTYFGTGATQTIDAKFNEAANFNGASNGSQIIISDADAFSPANNDLSFSVWINTTSTNVVAYIASKQDDGAATYEWQFYMNSNGTVVISVFTSAGSTIAIATSTATINDGNWHNIAFVIDTNTSVTVYVDKAGVTSSSWSGTMTNTSTDVSLGSGGTAIPAVRLLGKLDQARFFNTAITQSQIDSLYDDETTTTASTLNFPVGAGCFAAYQLDGDASDISGTYGGVTTDIGYTGLRFQPDMVWIKERSGTEWHNLFDSVRGSDKSLYPNESSAQATSSTKLTAFDANGFSLGSDNNVNKSSSTYVAWSWKAGGAASSNTSGTITSSVSANVAAGFSIVEFTTSANGTIGHGLSEAPQLIITKLYTRAGSWSTYSEPTGNTKYLQLDSDIAAATGTGRWNSTTPSASTFVLGSDFGSGYACICYCFHSVAGYQKIGSYTGTNSTNGPIVYTTDDGTATGTGGFEPAFLLIKGTQSTTQWLMIDNKRSTSNPRNKALFANLADAEGTNNSIDFFTNGFQPITTDGDSNRAETYIYLAIAADKDTSVPTQANSFSPTLYTGNGGTQSIDVGLKPDFVWVKDRDNNATSHTLADSVRGVNNTINSNTTGGQYNNTTYQYNSFDNDGFTVTDDNGGNYGVNGNGINYVSWNWKAGGLPTINSDGNITSIVSVNDAAGFSIVRYVGNEQASQTIGHGLSNSPEIAFIKQLDGGRDWIVPLFTETSGDYLELNDTAIKATDTNKWSAVSADTFTVGADPYTNGVGSPYIGYFFTSITGYQKVGSYTANGSTTGPIVYTTDDGTATGTGGFEPRYLLIKSADNVANWIILDKARTPNNPMEHDLKANSAAAEQTGTGNNYPQATTSATGFQVNTTDGAVNGSGTYIYLAIA